MSRAPFTFKQQDVTRALRGTVAAGIVPKRVEIDRNGKIVVIVGDAAAADEANQARANESDEITSSHRLRSNTFRNLETVTELSGDTFARQVASVSLCAVCRDRISSCLLISERSTESSQASR